MPAVPPELCLFDIAGTLMDDAGVTDEAYRRVLAEAGLRPDPEAIRARMGRRKPEVFLDLLAADGHAGTDESRRAEAFRLAARFDEVILGVLDEVRPRALPGAAEAVADLHRAGVRTGWTTGFSRPVAERALATIGIELGPAAAASDEVERGRPAPDLIHLAMRRAGVDDPARVATVGDTPNDLRAGDAAGCGWVVGVGHGTHGPEELAAFAHTLIVPTLEGLLGRLSDPG